MSDIPDPTREPFNADAAAAALKTSEELYRALVETTGTGYVIIDGEGVVLDANHECVRLTGHRELAEIRGRNVLEWTVAADRAANAAAVKECFERGFIRNFETTYAGPDGSVIPIEINATVVGIEARNSPDTGPRPPTLPPVRHVRVTVRDHGIGIPAALLPRIFDPFFTTKQQGSGTAYSVMAAPEKFGFAAKLGKPYLRNEFRRIIGRVPASGRGQ